MSELTVILTILAIVALLIWLAKTGGGNRGESAMDVHHSMSDIDPRLAEILRCLNDIKIRATYGPVGELTGIDRRDVGQQLGDRRIEASWVVNASTEMPTGYAPDQLHPDLTSSAEIIRTGEALGRRLSLWRSGQASTQPN